MVDERQNGNCVADTYWIFGIICQDKNGFTLWKKVVAGMSAGGKLKIAGKVFSKMQKREIDAYIYLVPSVFDKNEVFGIISKSLSGQCFTKTILDVHLLNLRLTETIVKILNKFEQNPANVLPQVLVNSWLHQQI